MIDLHSHVLPGLDDGARSLAEAVDLAVAAAAAGTSVLAGTPHVRADYPTTPADMAEQLRRVREALAERHVAVDVVGGGEIAIERLAGVEQIEALRPFGLAASRYLLVEFPYEGWPPDLAARIARVVEAGLRPVLAHPERNPEVQVAPARLAALVEHGALVQVTAGSLTGGWGRRAQATASELVRTGLAHLIASDAHRAAGEDIGLGRARHVVGGELGHWLTETVPRAIVENQSQIPARPPRTPRWRWRWR